jgi:transcriptional regulator with XRE-family HTH domain
MLSRLIAIQRREGWTDLQMAERLGISRSAWSMIRREVLPLSERVQMASARAFPELLGELVTSVTLTRDLPAAEAV